MSRLRQLISEVHRRSLWQVLAIYLAASWVVFEVVQTVTEGLGLPEWFPAFAALLLLIGLPIVLATAFVQEGVGRGAESGIRPVQAAGPGGLPAARAAEVVSAAAGVHSPVRRIFTWRNAITGGVLALALWGAVAGGWVLFGPGGHGVAASVDKSIAVLPFDNLSADPENAFFASGIHEDILTHLSKVRDLRVISRSSVMQYAETRANLRDVAEELGVAHIVEGSVRRAGDRVRVTAQLIDARTDQHLWADNFDRDLSDIFAIQTAVAQEIVSALEATLTPEEQQLITQAPTQNLDAYDSFLRARDVLNTAALSTRVSVIAQDLLEQAVEFDPEFAGAYALLAEVHGELYWFAYDRSPERLAAMKAAIDRAFQLQPELPEARAALAKYYYRGFYDYSRALEQLEIAHQQLPNSASILYSLGLTYRRLGRWDESIRSFEESGLLDPGNLRTRSERLNTLKNARRWQEARELSNELVAKYPGDATFAGHRALVFLYGEGDVAAALEALARVTPADDWFYTTASIEAALFDRDYETALAALSRNPGIFDLLAPGLTDQMAGEILFASGDREGATERLGSARIRLESEVQQPYSATFAWPHMALGLTYALLGEEQEAVEACRRAVAILPESRDKVHGPSIGASCARARALAGDTDFALDEIERLLGTPWGFTKWQLALDPRWDFLRDNPRFQSLLEKYE